MKFYRLIYKAKNGDIKGISSYCCNNITEARKFAKVMEENYREFGIVKIVVKKIIL